MVLATVALVTGNPVGAAEFRNRDNPFLGDQGEGVYPIPYQMPTVEEVTAVVERVHAYLETAAPTRVIDEATGKEITDFTTPIATAFADRGHGNAFAPWAYVMGVAHAGMLKASDATGDDRYRKFSARHFQFMHDRIPYFRRQADQFGIERGTDTKGPGVRRNSFKGAIVTETLDDSGAMGAALVKARLAKVGPDMLPLIEHLAAFVSKEQFRLDDGPWARRRPQPASLWADDYYMAVPFMAQMTRLTGDRRYVDDAVRHVLKASPRLFDSQTQLFTHGWHANQPFNPAFYWGRANGWVMMSLVELLDVLPADHPDRPKVLDLFRRHAQGVAALQSPAGLWRNLLDKTDSYEESSATAMFVYSIAHAINEGWISPVSYGAVALAGWNGLSTRISAHGQVLGTCVGTTLAGDNVYYYHRPTSEDGSHAVGAVLMAGSEMIRFLENEKIQVKIQWRTYHHTPLD